MADWRRGAYAATGALALIGGGWLVLRPAPPAVPTAPPEATTTARVTRTDVTVRDILSGTLGYLDQATLLAAGAGTLTWLPPVGTVIGPDQRLYEVDGRPVMLWTGARPAWRDFALGMTDGTDVTQLERCLVAYGFGAGLTVDTHFSAATATAVRRWQRAHGLPRTGAIRLGEVVFRPSRVRVGAELAALGAPLAPGTPVFTMTAAATAVTVNLDPTWPGEVHPGDKVSVSLPGGTATTNGHVVAVGAPLASTAPAGPAASGTTPGAATVTIPVTIALDLPAGATGPGIGPVQVAIVSAQDKGVLAVPIDALLAAPGGGFQVAVLDGGRRHLVPVRTRLFDESDGLVEVDGLPEGTVVEVPAT